MPNCCVIKNCQGKKFLDPDEIHYFRFKDRALKQKEWIESIFKGTGHFLNPKKLSDHSRICSYHFTEDDIVKYAGGFAILRPIALPTVFAPRDQLKSDHEDNKDSFKSYVKSLCRVCMKKVNGVEMNISNEISNLKYSVMEAVEYTMNIKMTDSDDLPSIICTACFLRIEAAFDLKHEILNSIEAFAKFKAVTSKCKYQKPSEEAQEKVINNIRKRLEHLKPRARTEFADPLLQESAVNRGKPFTRNSKNVAELCDSEEEKKVFGECSQNVPKSSHSDSESLPSPPPPPVKEEPLPKKQRRRRTRLDMYKLCKKCNHIPKSYIHLFNHLDESIEKNCIECYEHKFMCYICERKFMLASNKDKHIKADHAEYASRKKCDKCNKAIAKKSATSYELHMKTHYVKPHLLCMDCGKMFYSHKHLRLHMNVHAPDFWFTCDKCGYISKFKTSIHDHVRKCIGSIGTVVCEFCSRVFHRPGKLHQHQMLSHKEEFIKMEQMNSL